MDMVGESMVGVNEALAQTDAGKMANLKTVIDEAIALCSGYNRLHTLYP